MRNQHDHEHRHRPHGHDHQVDFESPAMADHAEREGELFLPLTDAAVGLLAAECDERGMEVRRVVDLGSGPGFGTGALARRFGAAEVVAADGSATMLARAAARATTLGLGPRVQTHQLELPDGLDQLGRADVIWASLVLHHVGDEVAALQRIKAALEPGGLLALVELAEPLRVVLPDVNLGRPGLWERLDAAWDTWFRAMRAELPGSRESADYRSMLSTAGYDVIVDETLVLDVAAPLDEPAARFAHDHLVRTRAQLASLADADDLAALDALLGGNGPGRHADRDDTAIRGSRHLFVASPRASS